MKAEKLKEFKAYVSDVLIDIKHPPVKLKEIEDAIDKKAEDTLKLIKASLNQQVRPGVKLAYIQRILNNHDNNLQDIFNLGISKAELKFKWGKMLPLDLDRNESKD